jgi:pyruvate ferredoxin oxidoreductase delta subunit
MAEEVTYGGVVDRPGSSRKNKTGSWRTFRPIITEKCIGCGICVQYCPEACIEIREAKEAKTKSGNPRGMPSRTQAGKKAVVDYDYCKGCLICVGECPHKAIESERDRK